MSKTLSIILTVFKVLKIISKVVFILCIVGTAGCLVGFFATAVFGGMLDGMIAGGFDVYSSCFACIIGIFACVGGAVFAFLSEKYFKNVLDAKTPFTFDGAKECFRLGIASLIISVAVSVASGIAEGIAWMLSNFGSLNFDVNVSFSLSTGLFFMFLSLIFKYGAELQASTENTGSQTENE